MPCRCRISMMVTPPDAPSVSDNDDDQPRTAELDQVLEQLARDPAVVATGGHAVLVVQSRT
jgi:shikimate kinase